jgi:hypothetical protein
VKISIFDVPGCEIKVLVDEVQSPAVYEIDFDGSDYPSGIYFYRIETVDFKQTRKMMLIK